MINDYAAKAEKAHLGVLRIAVSWKEVERSRDVYDWSLVDRYVDNAVAHNEQILFSVGPFIPNWAAGKPASPECSEWDGQCADYGPDLTAFKNDWVDFVRATVNRYRNKVAFWSFWNEPDYSVFLHDQDMDKFANTILLPAYQAARAIVPGMIIVGPDIMESRTKLTAILSHTCSQIQAVSVHLYKGATVQSRLDQFDNFVTTVNSACGASKKLWVTEFGFKIADVGGETQQGQYLVQALQGLNSRARAEKVFFYKLFNHVSESNYGICTWDWNQTQAELASYPLVRDYIRSTIP